MLCVKYGKNRLHGFRGDVLWKRWRRTDDDDGQTMDACLYYKLTYEPAAQGSYKNKNMPVDMEIRVIIKKVSFSIQVRFT